MDQRHLKALLYVFLVLILPLLSSSTPSYNYNPSFIPNPSINTPPKDPQYQTLPIIQDDSGFFYIDVTWKNASVHPFYHDHNQTKIQSPNAAKNDGKMVLTLYTNQSFVADVDCSEFLYYDCGDLDCQTNSYDSVDSSYLIAGTFVQGHIIDIGMQSPAFNMCGYSVIYAAECTRVFIPGFSGYLGMGFSMNAFFEVNRNFSIFLSDGNDGMSHTMVVGPDDDQDLVDTSSNFTQQWNTDKNWMITINDIEARVASGEDAFRARISMDKEYKLLFDINTNAIGMPIELYNYTWNILSGYGVSCSWAPNNMSCTYEGDMSALPTFYMTIEDQNTTAIEIRPQIYLYKNSDDSYTLMFSAIASGIPGTLQLNSDYQDSIVLGQPFLTYYYVHFSICQYYVQPFVTLYLAKHTPSVVSKSSKLYWIIGGAALLVAIILIIAACVIIRRRRRAKQIKVKDEEKTTVASSGRKENETVMRNSNPPLQQPLLSKTLNTSQETPAQSMKSLGSSQVKNENNRVWSNENIGYVDPNEITAYTYKKQKFRGLYESGADSFSLNDDEIQQ